MRLVKQHTSVPVPIIIYSRYELDQGKIGLSLVPGCELKFMWDGLDECNKERLMPSDLVYDYPMTTNTTPSSPGPPLPVPR